MGLLDLVARIYVFIYLLRTNSTLCNCYLFMYRVLAQLLVHFVFWFFSVTRGAHSLAQAYLPLSVASYTADLPPLKGQE